jgi:uncharacterized DUF497 family protein
LTRVPVFGRVGNVEYEWDEAKATANFAKHGISFTAAAWALEDTQRIDILDERFDYGEERIQSLCGYRETVLFVVSTTPAENVCRIISARKATRHEQEQYFKGGALLT